MNPDAYLDLAERQTFGPRKARARAVEERTATRAEKAQAEKERQLAHWRLKRRQREEILLVGPHAHAARDLIKTLATLTSDAGDPLIEQVRRGPWRAADSDTRFLILAVIDNAIIELRESSGLPLFSDPLPEEPPNVFLVLREMLSD